MSTILIEPSLPTLREIADKDGVHAALAELLVAEREFKKLPESDSRTRALDRVNKKWHTLIKEKGDILLIPCTDD